MKVWMLFILSFFSLSALATEFSHIKLRPEFEEYLIRPQSKSTIKGARSMKATASGPSSGLPMKVLNVLLGSPLGTTGDITSPIPVDGEESPLYQEIRNQLEATHQQLGLDHVRELNRLNQQFNLGSSNFSGFSWQKPFGVVQVYADRQVTPNVFTQNWLVMDTFTFEIEATTFLEKLNEAGLASMSGTEIGAFAGITFKRVYTYWSYANSYQEGLTANFTTLFLPFLKFSASGIEKMGKEEIIKREDTWTASAGGLISTPPLYNLSFSAGVLAQYDYQNSTTVQSQPTPEQRFQVGILAKKNVTAGATAELQLDFFKLIKFSLLRYDLNYEYSSGKEFTLGFKTDQWNQIKASAEDSGEFKTILRGFGSVKRLEPYVVRLDESSSSAVTQRGSILIFGKMQKQKTEQIRVIKDNIVRVFYKNYAQNVKVVQNIFSRIFSAIIYKLFKLPVGATNAAIYSRQMSMEYEATHPQAADPKILRIDSSEQFSFVLTQYYNAARTDRWVDRKFKNDLVWFVDNFTTLPKTYKSDIRNGVLKGPMTIESNLRVEKAGFQFLVGSPVDSVFGNIAKVCESQKAQDWMNENRRKELLEDEELDRTDECVKNIGLKYLGFKLDYGANFLKPSLAKFKDFVTKYYKVAGNLESLTALFGAENTFVSGHLKAQTGLGMPFNTTFSSGQFRGLGVIDNFKRSTGSRVPASIASE